MEPYDGFHHYLPVADSLMRTGAYLTGAGRGVIGPGSEYPPVGHPALYQFEWIHGRILPEYALILVKDGTGEYESKQSGNQRIEGDSVILLAPKQWHRYRPDKKTGWTEKWVSFNGELMHRFCALGLLSPGLYSVEPEHSARLGDEFDALLEQVHANPTSNSIALSMWCMALVTRTLEPFASDGADCIPSTSDPMVQQALELIWTTSHYPLAIDKIANELEVKRRTLDRRFVAHRGRTILEEINYCRLTRAKRLLIETELPINLITNLAGFTSNERMRLALLESEGIPPAEFRKRHRQG
ncbi:helix-turn-helix domain-containing protein [Aeoliella sp.]|uniref:helix-turn-helix domain-containing protein n=1 Tax=Aeoliella sp. TaxID=2795800 RepID=UPI003CCBBF4F